MKGRLICGAAAGDSNSIMKNNIEAIYSVGFDTYMHGIKYDEIRLYINNSTDYHKTALNRAAELGIKVHLIMDCKLWCPTNVDISNCYERFIRSSTSKTKFYDDLTWVLQRYKNYPAFEGIHLEEPYDHWDDCAANENAGLPCPNPPEYYQNIKDLWNDFHVNCRIRIDNENMGIGFHFGFNWATYSKSSSGRMGCDYAYVSNNITNSLNKPLYTYFVFQSSAVSGTEFGNQYTEWHSRLPNIEILNCAYIQGSAELSSPECQASGGYSSIKCYNQVVYDLIKWAIDNNEGVWVFNVGFFWAPSIYYTNYVNTTYPGANAGEKLTNLLNIDTCPKPQFSFNINQVYNKE